MNSSNLPAFVPAFYASSYGDEHDDELEFSAEHIVAADASTSATTASAAFVSDAAAARAITASCASDDEDDDALFVPKTTYRDTHHVFANGPCDLVFNSESFLESSFLSLPGKAPVFVLESASAKKLTTAPIMTASPLSPSSYSAQVDVPQKESYGFHCVNPVMPSRAQPSAIMAALQTALARFDCDFEVVDHWTIRATLLCVAEEIAFTAALTRVDADRYEVDFLLRSGDEATFCELAEHIRSLCADVDDEALPFLAEPLSAWLDASQELTGRRYAIKEKDVRTLLEELMSDAHPDSALHVARAIKNHCRHRGNRKLFVQADHRGFLDALKWMLSGSDDVARFGVFALAQFARERESDGAAPFFESPYDKSSFALLLDDVQSRQRDAPCGRFTVAMVEQVQQSWVFC